MNSFNTQTVFNYSIIVATRPDPTVRPPSRYLNTVFLHIFYAFGWQNPHKTAVFAYCIFICLSSWHRFGTVGTSSSFTNTNWDLSLALFVTSPLIIQYATTHYFSTRAYSLTNPSSCITSKTISSPYSMWEYPPSE